MVDAFAHGVDADDPRGWDGRAEYQAAVHLERSAVEVEVSQSIAPGLGKLVDQTRDFVAREAFIHSEVPIHGIQGGIARSGDLMERPDRHGGKHVLGACRGER